MVRYFQCSLIMDGVTIVYTRLTDKLWRAQVKSCIEYVDEEIQFVIKEMASLEEVINTGLDALKYSTITDLNLIKEVI